MAKRRSLIAAAEAGELEEVKRLLENGADIHRVLASGHNALRGAVSGGYKDVVAFLLASGADIHAVSQCGWSSLYIATRKMHSEILQLLIQEGANPNQRTDSGDTPVHVAAENEYAEGLMLLLNAGARFTYENDDGYTPLHLASQQNASTIISLLVSGGAEIDAQDRHGYTAMHYAAELGCEETVTELLKHRPDLEVAYKGRWVPVHLYGHNHESDHKDVLRLFGGGYGDDSVTKGSTPLHCAVREGHIAIVEKLLDAGADIFARTEEGLSALKVATRGNRIDVADKLCQLYPEAIESNATGQIDYTDVPNLPEKVAGWLIDIIKNADNGFLSRHDFFRTIQGCPPGSSCRDRVELGGIVLTNSMFTVELMVVIEKDSGSKSLCSDVYIEGVGDSGISLGTSVFLQSGIKFVEFLDGTIEDFKSKCEL